MPAFPNYIVIAWVKAWFAFPNTPEIEESKENH